MEPSTQWRRIFVAKGVNQLSTGIDLLVSVTQLNTIADILFGLRIVQLCLGAEGKTYQEYNNRRDQSPIYRGRKATFPTIRAAQEFTHS